MFGINPEDYDLRAELSSCCNEIGVVYLAQYKPSGQHVAVKKFRMDKIKDENEMFGVRFNLLDINFIYMYISFLFLPRAKY